MVWTVRLLLLYLRITQSVFGGRVVAYASSHASMTIVIIVIFVVIVGNYPIAIYLQ